MKVARLLLFFPMLSMGSEELLMIRDASGSFISPSIWENNVIPPRGANITIAQGKQLLFFQGKGVELGRVILGKDESDSTFFMANGDLTLMSDDYRDGSLIVSCAGKGGAKAVFHLEDGAFKVERDIVINADSGNDLSGITIHKGSLNAQNFITDRGSVGFRTYTILESKADITFLGDFSVLTSSFMFNMSADEAGVSVTKVNGALTLNGDLNINLEKYSSSEPLILFEYNSPDDLIGALRRVNLSTGIEGAIDYYHKLDNGKYAVALLP